jgi:hypothetical protein
MISVALQQERHGDCGGDARIRGVEACEAVAWALSVPPTHRRTSHRSRDESFCCIFTPSNLRLSLRTHPRRRIAEARSSHHARLNEEDR